MIRLLVAFLLVALALPGSARAAEVVLWHTYRGAEQAGLRAATEAWSARTGHRVALVDVPFGAFDSKVETAVPRGNGPDAFIAAHGSLGKWASMGVVGPWSGDPDALVGHRGSAVDAVTWEGRVYGVPLALKSLLLLYDPTVIDTPPATVDALLALAATHTGGGRYGLGVQIAEPYTFAPWRNAFGAAHLDAAEFRLDGDADRAAYALVARIQDAKVLPPQPTYELLSRLYDDGKLALVINGPWFVTDVQRPIAAAPLPFVAEAGGPARPYLTVDAGFVAEQASEPALAAALVAFLAGPEGAAIRQDRGGQAVTLAQVEPSDPLLQVQLAQAVDAVPLPTDARAGAMWESQATALRRLTRGVIDADRAASEAQTTFSVLARARPEPADPRPYWVVLGVALLLGLLRVLGPLRDPAFRARVRAHGRDYLWVLPAGLAMTVLVALPFVTGAAVSLFAHHQGEWTFVGFRHFLDILLSRDWPPTSPMSFVFTLGVTVLWTVANLFLHVSLGVGLALVLREPWIRLRGVWRALLIIPWAVPNYITALIWKGMFHAQYGAINALIGAVLGREGPVELDWFGSFATAFAANLATNTWLGFPFMMVVTLGALQSIPRDLEEAAEVDGASWWLRFRHVVWPLLLPALLPAVILGSVWTFNMFNVVYLVSAGGPDGSTEILISEAYRWAFSRGNRYGYAAAYAVLIFGVLLAYSRVANRLVGRRVL